MTPFRQAQLIYETEECGRSFYEDLLLHLEGGYVFSGPGAIIYGRAVDHYAPIEQIRDPSIQFQNPNAWWIWMAAGQGALGLFLEYEPFPLSHYGFERCNIPRFYPRESLIRHVKRADRLRHLLLQGPNHTQGPATAQASGAINGG